MRRHAVRRAPMCGSTRTQPFTHAGPAARVNMSSPLIRTHPHRGFSLLIRRMRSRTPAAIGGLPPVAR